MRARVRAAGIYAATLFLSSCASLNYVHDPKFAAMSREQVPAFLKSIRCELITFYEANRERRAQFRLAKEQHDRKYAALHHPYFPLADDPTVTVDAPTNAPLHAFGKRKEKGKGNSKKKKVPYYLLGGVYLDLKVIDTIGIPAVGTGNTSIDRKQTINATTSKTWHFGPSLQDQNTYQLQWAFVIEQTATLYAGNGEPDPFQCYNSLPPPSGFDQLARGGCPEREEFKRILVNGTIPLAAWLQDSSAEMWTSYVAGTKEIEEQERLIPAQMLYTFAVQTTVGLDVRFFEITPKWNPLALNVSGSVVQTSQVQFALNGLDAPFAAAAKAGLAGAKGKPLSAPEFMLQQQGEPDPATGHFLLWPLPLIPSP
jgi:hypothetical protein